jgi:hypothetical protein
MGEGLLAWLGIIAAAQKTGKPLYIIEHDLPKDRAAYSVPAMSIDTFKAAFQGFICIGRAT